MKIEAGQSYKTRDGRKASKPTWNSDHGCWYLAVDEANRAYQSDGTHGGKWVCNDPNLDLVAEWADEPTGPVVVETVKRIVPGVYGIVDVVQAQGSTPGCSYIRIIGAYPAAELRAAVATLTEIADALDEGAR